MTIISSFEKITIKYLISLIQDNLQYQQQQNSAWQLLNHKNKIIITKQINLPGVLKTGLPEILSQVQHIAGNLSTLNLLKALILLV